jgi:hypothetical protein
VEWAEQAEDEGGPSGAAAGGPRPGHPSAPAVELKGGVGGGSGPLIQPRHTEKPAEAEEAD